MIQLCNNINILDFIYAELLGLFNIYVSQTYLLFTGAREKLLSEYKINQLYVYPYLLFT